MAKYPKIDLKKTRGYPMAMVWVFSPIGPKLYTGSLDMVKQALKDGPLCHGFVRYFSRGIATTRLVHLFGDPAQFRKVNDKYHYTTIHHVSKKDLQTTDLYQWLRPYLSERRMYIVTEHLPDGAVKLIGRWRRMPSTYLKELANAA